MGGFYCQVNQSQIQGLVEGNGFGDTIAPRTSLTARQHLQSSAAAAASRRQPLPQFVRESVLQMHAEFPEMNHDLDPEGLLDQPELGAAPVGRGRGHRISNFLHP